MLETEEVDDDFFTPIAGTALANIFGNPSRNREITENDSLKYIPPKPQNIVPKKQEQTKATECIFACALIGHEWCNNVYTARGKLGFAIMKIQKTGEHNIILYDCNKITLSSTIVSRKLEVTVKNNAYISYYDSLQKYWSIYGTEEEILKITEVLKNLDAIINYSTYSEKGPPEINKSETETNALQESGSQNRESDTDSSVNRKTKASILNRMANMGHSVLPSRTLPAERTSDSSDTNEIETQPKTRHKPVKTSIKRNSVENTACEPQHLYETHQRIIATKTEPENNIAVYNSQLIPLPNTSVIAGNSNEMAIFMSEQRISNSELRININRITDKVDLVLDKMSNIDKEKNTNVSTDILMKLLTEYENKIKVYEELLKSREAEDKTNVKSTFKYLNKDNDMDLLEKKISEVEKENEEKSNEISNLQKEITILKEKQSQEIEHQASKKNELLAKIKNIECELQIKCNELTEAKNKTLADLNVNNESIKDKVKNIMNDTFQTISMNFDNTNAYDGETIKRIVGTVIKKITMQTLSEL